VALESFGWLLAFAKTKQFQKAKQRGPKYKLMEATNRTRLDVIRDEVGV
jgi:hypothetical protein